MKFKFLNKALLLEISSKNKDKNKKILVVADLHIGHEEALNKAGIFLPRLQFKETLSDLEEIFNKIGKVDEIIVLGDLKHEFGEISQQEWRETQDILDFFNKKIKKSGKIILIKGNHDAILEPIAKRKELKIRDFYIIDGGGNKKDEKDKICFLHGHKLFPECLDEKIKFLVLGHRHPAITLHDKYKKEKYKCFLVGKWKRKEVIILPSFLGLIEGTDMINLEERCLFIPEKSLRNFQVKIVESNRVYDFGRLKDINRLT